MARGIRITKRVSPDHLAFLKLIEDREANVFTLEEAGTWMGATIDETQKILQNLSYHGVIERLERGKYCRYGFRNDKVIGSFISGNGTISYGSALHLHNMTEQIPNVNFIQIPFSKRNCSLFGVRYRFVKVLPSRIFGIILMGFGNETFPVTDREKTLLDCFEIPGNTPGYDTVIKAFIKTECDPGKLLEYGIKLGNLSTLKRMAFLSQTFSLTDFGVFRKEVKKLVQEKYTLFDPTGPAEGPFINDWKIRINIPIDHLHSITI